MFYSDFEDDALDNIEETLDKYRQYRKDGKKVYFTEEQSIMIVEHLDTEDKWEEALSFINEMMPFYPLSTPLKLKKTDILISLDRIKEAQETLSGLMEYETREVDYYLLRIEIDIILEQEASIRKWMQSAKENLGGDEYSDFMHDLIEMLETYDLSDDIFYCLHTLALSGSISDELSLLLPLYTEKTRKYNEALEISNKLIDKNSYNVSAWLTMGIAYSGLKKYEEAIDAFLYAQAINTSMYETLPRISSCYIKLRKFGEARDYLLEYLQKKPNDITALKTVAFCYAKQKEYTLARYYYEAALKQDPTDHSILEEIAQIYLDKKEYHTALQFLKKTLLITNKVAHYYYLIAYCYYELKQPEEAIKYYSLALTINLKKKDYWEGLLKALVKIKNYDHLYAMSLKAIDNTHQQYFFYYLAYAEYKMNFIGAAQKSLQKAIKHCPGKYKKISLFIPLSEIYQETHPKKR